MAFIAPGPFSSSEGALFVGARMTSGPEMSTSTTMTIRMDENVKAKLVRLARDRRRSRSFLAAEAVSCNIRLMRTPFQSSIAYRQYQ